jgi:hypothetical protein
MKEDDADDRDRPEGIDTGPELHGGRCRRSEDAENTGYLGR